MRGKGVKMEGKAKNWPKRSVTGEGGGPVVSTIVEGRRRRVGEEEKRGGGGWREMHVIWSPLPPEPSRSQKSDGVGGGEGPRLADYTQILIQPIIRVPEHIESLGNNKKSAVLCLCNVCYSSRKFRSLSSPSPGQMICFVSALPIYYLSFPVVLKTLGKRAREDSHSLPSSAPLPLPQCYFSRSFRVILPFSNVSIFFVLSVIPPLHTAPRESGQTD